MCVAVSGTAGYLYIFHFTTIDERGNLCALFEGLVKNVLLLYSGSPAR